MPFFTRRVSPKHPSLPQSLFTSDTLPESVLVSYIWCKLFLDLVKFHIIYSTFIHMYSGPSKYNSHVQYVLNHLNIPQQNPRVNKLTFVAY